MKPGQIEKWILILITVLAIKVFFFPPYELQLRSEEPRRAVISMEMIYSGNYLEPHLNGWPYYNKPPLFNWLLVAFMKLFNSFDEWVIRMPGLISHLLISLGIYFFTRTQSDRRSALSAALIYLTAGELLFYGSVIAGQIDLFFSLLVFLQLISLYLGLSQTKRYLIYLSYFFMGLGVLTKGVPSIAFQLLTLLVWIFIHKKVVRKWMIGAHLSGLIISGVLVGYYFVLFHRAGGDSTVYLINLFYEAAQKSALETGGGTLWKNFLSFPGAFLKLVLPWVLLAFSLVIPSVRSAIWNKPLVRFSIAVIFGNLLLYWFSGYVTTRYLFPFIPFIAIIIAALFPIVQDLPKSRILDFFYGFILLLIILVPAGFLGYSFSASGEDIRQPWIKFILTGAISIILFVAMRKWREHRLLLTVLFLLCLKWYTHWTYYPSRFTDERKNSLIAQIPALFLASKGQSIYLLGDATRHDIDISLGSWSLISTHFLDPMPLSYQLPYYIEKEQGEVMQFHTAAVPDQHYLVRENDLSQFLNPGQYEILYEFVDDWKRIPLALIKTAKQE